MIARVVVSLLLAGLIGWGASGGPDELPSIVLVTIDTLRREHLGCYGYFRPTSPRIDALARESLLFEHAVAAMASTFPSHATMLTGLYPHQHGQTSNAGAVRHPFRPSEGCASAAGVLASIGYRTAGFVGSVVLGARTGIGAGFETYSDAGLGRGREVMDEALAWLAGVPAQAPVFLWVHLWDVHEPNDPPAKYAALFRADDALRAWVRARGIDPAALAGRFSQDAGVKQRFFGASWAEAAPERPARKGTVPPDSGLHRKRKARKGTDAIDERSVLGLFDRYDACVRLVDDQVGRLIDALKAGGRWEDSIFVFTADHGQSLRENLHLGHGKNTNLNTFVPLLIRFPSSSAHAPGRRSGLVSLVDLMPTVLAGVEHEGLRAFRGQFEGQDVLADGFSRAHVVTAESTQFHGAKWKPLECALLSERWKYVPGTGRPGELYDLAGAGEFVDVRAQHPDVARELESTLESLLARTRVENADADEAPNDAETEELLRQLEALGYGGEDD